MMGDEQQRVSPADLPLVTLDNNALIALRDHEPDEDAIRELLAMNAAGRIVANVTLSTGIEAQRPVAEMGWADQIAWLEGLGIARANIFTGPRTLGFATPGEPATVTFDPWLETELNRRLHAILFPAVPFMWTDHLSAECARRGLPVEVMLEYDLAERPFYIPPTPSSPRRRPTPRFDALAVEEQDRLRTLHTQAGRKWHNAKNDALGFYNHLTQAWHTTHPEHAVFVTNDDNFFKETKATALQALGCRGKILRPADAATFLRALSAVPVPN